MNSQTADSKTMDGAAKEKQVRLLTGLAVLVIEHKCPL